MSSDALNEVLRKSIDLNIRYYSSLGRLAAEYMRELAVVMTEPMKAVASSATSPIATAPTPTPSSSQTPAVMVMEGDTGSIALGVFLVENHLPMEVDSKVVASFFKEPARGTIQPDFTFDPQRIVLKPGEQILVQASCPISAEIEANVRYKGEFAVPGLKGSTIPVVLRRRES